MASIGIVRSIALCVAAGTWFAAAPAIAAAVDDGEICAKASGDAAIAACSRAIASGNFSGDTLATLQIGRAHV